MELSKEQLIEVKKQLIEQIETTFPEDRKNESIRQIEAMDDTQLIEFLKQNNLIKTGDKNSEQEQCIFCSMVFGDIPITKIDENEKAIAILELNPISNGHSLVIPKDHRSNSEDLNQETQTLAKKLSEKIKEIFKPKDVQIIPGNVMGHEILNILPIYENESLESPRIKKTPEELKELQNKFIDGQIAMDSTPQEIISKEKIEQISEKDMWLPKKVA